MATATSMRPFSGDPLRSRLASPKMARTMFVGLPVHRGRRVVEDLHSIHAAIPLARFRILAEDQREGDETAGILWPALKDGEFKQ